MFDDVGFWFLPVSKVRFDDWPRMKHREKGYGFLHGRGLEVGAFANPARLPVGCTVKYFDFHDPEVLAKLFPEVDPKPLVKVDYIGDVDRGGLRQFDDGEFDFFIANHVIEHLANPVLLLKEAFRLVKPGGRVVVSAPDKRFTFDKDRPLTPIKHLMDDFRNGVTESSDEHYLEFIRYVAPDVYNEPGRNLADDVVFNRTRREHVHVWDSVHFAKFLSVAFRHLKLHPILDFVSSGDENGLEYFAVWRKPRFWERVPGFRRKSLWSGL